MALTRFYAYVPYIIYDGTNGADVVATFNAPPWSGLTGGCTASLTSQSGGVAVLHFTGVDGIPANTRDLTLNIGDCLQFNNSPYATPSGTQDLFYTALTNAPAVSTAVKYGGHGQSILGALSVGTTNITVNIKPAQPDTGYVANAFIDGPALALGTVTVGTPVKTSASVVTVPITLGGLLGVTLSSSVVSVEVTAPQA